MAWTERPSPTSLFVIDVAAGAARLASAVLVLVAAAATPLPAAPDLFDDIHARVRLLEDKRQTIRARFTETTVSSLLVKPMVSEGVLVGAKPASLSMTYTSPERKVVVMDGNRLTIVHPGRGEVERIDTTEITKRVERYFVNANPDQLRASFAVRAFVDPEVPAWYQLDLVPRRKQIRQGLDRLQIWIAREPLLLTQIRITFAGGDTTTVTIKDAELNVPLPADAFKVDAPRATPK
jgi:outer membrane lipoprotein-sorting protein